MILCCSSHQVEIGIRKGSDETCTEVYLDAVILRSSFHQLNAVTVEYNNRKICYIICYFRILVTFEISKKIFGLNQLHKICNKRGRFKI